MTLHYAPDADSLNRFRRVAKCGVVCWSNDSRQPQGTVDAERVDCPACLDAARQRELFR